jgi:hypothetical protein
MYYVAFEHVQGPCKGIRYWCVYPSKEAFLVAGNNPEKTKVVAEGPDEFLVSEAAHDYDPRLLVQAAHNKAEERRLAALKRLEETGDRRRFTLDLRNSQEKLRMELMGLELMERYG